MFEYFSGTLIAIHIDHIIIDIAGIGMRVFIPATNKDKLPELGTAITLFISFIVREFSQTLYGFLEHSGKNLFEKIITISGVGPKLALGLLSAFTLQELGDIIALQDAEALVKAPGVGKKTAERLLIELKGLD